MRTKRMLLAVLAVALAVPAGAAAVTRPPGSDFEWGQLPAWIPSTVAPPTAETLPGATFEWGQPPAWIAIAAPAAVAIPGSSFEWGQPPAWVPIAPA